MNTLSTTLCASILAIGVPASLGLAQASPSSAAGASDEKKSSESQTTPTPSKTLDDLLGLDDVAEQDRSAADAAARDSQDELDRKLNEAEIADRFALAIEKMSLSADLLDTQFDAGLGTQRVQEDILAKLAQLIDQCKKNPSSGSCSSSSAGQQPKSQQNNPGQQNKPTPPGDQRPPNASDSQQGASPPLQEGDINTVLEETRAEWGNLPQRIRDALNQGKRDKYSSLYSQLTAEYYKRLAEEDSP